VADSNGQHGQSPGPECVNVDLQLMRCHRIVILVHAQSLTKCVLLSHFI